MTNKKSKQNKNSNKSNSTNKPFWFENPRGSSPNYNAYLFQGGKWDVWIDKRKGLLCKWEVTVEESMDYLLLRKPFLTKARAFRFANSFMKLKEKEVLK